MAFLVCSSRKRVYYTVLFIFAVILFLIFSWNGILGPKFIENELELEWEESILLKHANNVHNSKLLNLDFKFILTPNSCSDSDDFLAVIIVTSHYNNVETRSAMRRSFTSEELKALKLKRVFLLGQAPGSVYMSEASILHESKRFGDIIQGSFLEAYRNLTYKHVMGLKWVTENCQSPKYVIKMDDDIVFNVHKIITLLNTINLPKKSIAGYVLRDMKPIREPVNKWYVTQEEYHFSNYPSFVSGWFYITTPEVAAKLVLLSNYYKYFWIDDVYVTGVLARSLKIKQVNLRQYFTVHSEFLQCCIAAVKKRLDCDILVGPNGGDNNLFYEFNKVMERCENERCQQRIKPINETCVAERKVNLRGGNSIIENYRLH